MKSVAAVLAVAALVAAQAQDFTDVDSIINGAIQRKVTPGAVAAMSIHGKLQFAKAYGSFTYGDKAPVTGDNPAVEVDTKYDLASLTKVTTTTSCIATFYQRGELALHTPIADPALLGPDYANNGKSIITVENCLLHNAGYPPDPNPMYWSDAFACPATAGKPVGEVFTCVDQAYAGLMKQTLINPVGAKYVYSDLSMITLQYVVGTLAKNLGYITPADLHPSCAAALGDQEETPGMSGLERSCYYEAYARLYVFKPLDMSNTGFLPAKESWGAIAPTWQDTYYRDFWPQGQVSDENSFALGGIAGHAGVFSNVVDLMKLMSWLIAPPPSSDTFLNATTVDLFTTVHNVSQSSRALGWDTNNYQANTYRGCSQLSSTTFTHTGYTGTQLCGDKERGLVTMLLTNRCYPNKTAQMDTIHVTRQQWNDAVLAIYNNATAPA